MEDKGQNNMDELLLKYSLASNVLNTGVDNLIKEYEFRTQTNLVEHTKSRVKGIESATKKLKKKGYELTPENLENYIHDMVGLRIVCTLQDEVDEIVNLIQQSNLFNIIEENDYISHPKASGYQSYHMNVLVPIPFQDSVEYVEGEIQIRTITMDAFAAVEHKIQYKNENLAPDIADYIQNQMYCCSEYLNRIDRTMQQLGELGADDSKKASVNKAYVKSYRGK